MLFSSIPFLYYFLPAVLILYWIVPKRGKNGVLLLASLFFYAWGEKRLVYMFAASIFAGWIFGLLIGKNQGKPLAKLWVTLSVLMSLGLLGYFKYTDFLISSINGLVGSKIPLQKIALPIGISFYTFQILSYTIDVYRGTVPAQKNLIDFAAYVALFPQLIAGPIVRYSDIALQLKDRIHSVDKTAAGIRRFTFGLAKKVFLANLFGELCMDFRASGDPSVLYYWLYAVAFMMQIYFDFSGYSDMAIGLGKIFGFEFMENFQYPYISGSITEFWRRWHISLSSWFRDYVYIPLGGNRKGMARQILNILIVWLATGLWHGAAWNFVLWGLLYAVLLMIEKLWLKKWLDQHKGIGHVYVLFAVMLGFVLFNAESLAQTIEDVAGLFAFGRLPLVSENAVYALRSYGCIFLAGIIGATPLPKQLAERFTQSRMGRKLSFLIEPLLLAGMLLLVTAYLVDGSFNPFLYFRF